MPIIASLRECRRKKCGPYTFGQSGARLYLVGRWGRILRPQTSLRCRERLHESVAKFDAVVEILDTYALVFAMGAVVFQIEKHAGDAVGGDAGDAEIFAVGGAGGHRGDDGDSGPHCGEGAIESAGHFREERGGPDGDDWNDLSVHRFLRDDGDAYLWIGDDVLESFTDMLRVFAGKDPAVDVGARHLRERVWRVAAGEHGGDASGVKERIVIGIIR